MSLWRSLKLFRRNAGLLTSASFATVAVLVTLAGVEAIVHGKYADAILIFWPMVGMSWVLRWKLLFLAVRFGRPVRYAAVGIAIAYILRPKGGWFPGDDWIMISVIALYFGLIFWWNSGSFSVLLSLAVMPKEDQDEVDEGEAESGKEPGTEQPARLGNHATRHTGR